MPRARAQGERAATALDVMGPSAAVDDIEGVTMLGSSPPVLSRASRIAQAQAIDLDRRRRGAPLGSSR